MNHFEQSGTNKWNTLAQEVRRGSHKARERFVEELTPHMERIVRHTVRHGRSLSPRDRRIMEEYQQLCPGGRTPTGLSRDEVVSRVALRVCYSVVGQLISCRNPQAALETVRGL